MHPQHLSLALLQHGQVLHQSRKDRVRKEMVRRACPHHDLHPIHLLAQLTSNTVAAMAEIEATIVGLLITTKATTHGTTSQVTVDLQPSFQEAATLDIVIITVNQETTIQVNEIDTMILSLRLGHLVPITKITITAVEMFR